MSDETLAKRVASRWIAAQADDEEPHDPSNGVLFKWQYDSLTDKSAWKGYRYRLYTWTWEAANYADQDEPDDWGDNKLHGPEMTLDEVVDAIGKSPFKWEEWIDKSAGSFQSKVKKTKKTVTQGIAEIARVDGKPLTYEEREHIEDKLKL